MIKCVIFVLLGHKKRYIMKNSFPFFQGDCIIFNMFKIAELLIPMLTPWGFWCVDW